MADLVTGLVTLPIPLEARGELALVTVVHARLGNVSFGTSPGEAEVMATLRAARESVLDAMRQSATILAGEVATRDGLAADVAWVEEFPPVTNHPAASALAKVAARRAGLSVASPDENPFRWSEDFGWFSRRTPGALIGLGAGRNHASLHAGDFDFPDQLLAKGVDFWAALLTTVASAGSDALC
jgi:metal-dependent amidase/aminoacylase/carboxypeptidase family protein